MKLLNLEVAKIYPHNEFIEFVIYMYFGTVTIKLNKKT